jgi:TRAP-type C4-dicarboxylate transport system substrate-binding protein
MRHVTAAALAFALAALAPATKAAEPIELRLASTTVPSSKVNVWGLIPWSEDVKKASNGLLDIKLFYNNSIANPANVYDRTLQGVADISFGIMGPFYDLFPRTMVSGLPYEANNDTETSVALSRLFQRGLISEEYSKVKVLSLFTFAPSAVNTNKEIKTAADMAGLKIAASGRIVGEVVKALGAVPVTMGPPDFYQAMQRGTVQGIMVGWPAIMSFHLDEVTNHHLETQSGQFPAFVFMNKEAFAKLPAAGQKAIDELSGPVFYKRMGEVTDRQEAEGREATRPKPGQSITRLDPKEEARWKQLTAPVTEGWAKSTPNGAAILAAFREEIQKIRKGM